MISMLLKARKMALQTETSVAGIKIQKKNNNTCERIVLKKK
jgi:hypothetical protein